MEAEEEENLEEISSVRVSKTSSSYSLARMALALGNGTHGNRHLGSRPHSRKALGNRHLAAVRMVTGNLAITGT